MKCVMTDAQMVWKLGNSKDDVFLFPIELIYLNSNFKSLHRTGAWTLTWWTSCWKRFQRAWRIKQTQFLRSAVTSQPSWTPMTPLAGATSHSSPASPTSGQKCAHREWFTNYVSFNRLTCFYNKVELCSAKNSFVLFCKNLHFHYVATFEG